MKDDKDINLNLRVDSPVAKALTPILVFMFGIGIGSLLFIAVFLGVIVGG